MAYRWNDRKDYEPCFSLYGFPVYAVTLIVGIQIAAVVLIALLMGSGHEAWTYYLRYDSFAVFHQFQLWRIFTYPLLNPPAGLLFFAIQMYFLYQFGREVERFLGRNHFLLFYAALIVAGPVILTLFRFPGFYGGSDAVNFGVFIAFVVIYPNMPILFSLTARWVAVILIGIVTLQCLAYGLWPYLTVFLGETLCAALLIRHYFGKSFGVISKLKNFLQLRSSRKYLREVEPPRVRSSNIESEVIEEEDEDEDLHASIDPLLDKIAKKGISSLTAKEKERLERARTSLLEKERKN
ncbi:MAG: rhomboid family intramembrane serine protease [Chthoniobacterales bacterium]